MKKIILISLSSIAFLVGVILFIHAYFIEKTDAGNITGAVLTISAFIGAIVLLVFLLKEKKPHPFVMDMSFDHEHADERLKEELSHRDEITSKLNEELNRKYLRSWERRVRNLLKTGDIPKAIESIGEENAQMLIRKAQLCILIFQFPEAEQYYKQAVTAFPSFYTYYEIASFYQKQHRITQSIDYYNHCLNLSSSLNERADVLNSLGILHKTNNAFQEAFESYTESLKIYMDLASRNPETYLPNVATTLNNLGVLHNKNNAFKEAFESYTESLKIHIDLASRHPETYLPDVAATLDNLGTLHYKNNALQEAFESYTESLKISRNLASRHPETYLPDVAATLDNLGNLHQANNSLQEAFESYTESLKIYEDLASMNPDAYLPDVAVTLNNLGTLHQENNALKEAFESYTESLKIRRDLASRNPDAYLPGVAMTLNNLGALHKTNNAFKEAFESYTEALKIRRNLASKHPDAYLPDVAMTLYNLGHFHQTNNSLQEAFESYTESLKISRDLASKNPDAFLPDVATTLLGLSSFYLHIEDKELSLNFVFEDKALSFKYVKEAKEALKNCKNTPYVQKLISMADSITNELFLKIDRLLNVSHTPFSHDFPDSVTLSPPD